MFEKDITYYKPNLDEVINRYKALYEATSPGHAIVYTIVPAPQPETVPPLNQVDFDGHMEDYLDLCLRNYEASLEVSRQVPDDLIPTFGPNFGIGEYSAFIDGDVVFTEDTSWAAPIIHDWPDLDRLELRPDAYWVRMMERAMSHLRMRCSKAPIPLVRGYYSPLDMAHALRGEALFTDFSDSPEQVHRLMDFSAKAVIWLANRLRPIIGGYFGGSVAGAWLRPGTICMSEDIACLVSPRTYAKFARPYTQQVIDAMGCGQIHTHSLGVRTIPEISKLNNLLGIQISEDPNTEPVFQQLDWLLPRVNGIPLTVTATSEQIKSRFTEILAQVNITFCANVESIAEGCDLVAWVRAAEAK
ncbi:MAG TPA: hypothetical protein VHO48_07375 [Anaerolineaceae bacterium]|nr:hypothetical protein [Anaerolineaceae bacterium]